MCRIHMCFYLKTQYFIVIFNRLDPDIIASWCGFISWKLPTRRLWHVKWMIKVHLWSRNRQRQRLIVHGALMQPCCTEWSSVCSEDSKIRSRARESIVYRHSHSEFYTSAWRGFVFLPYCAMVLMMASLSAPSGLGYGFWIQKQDVEDQVGS